MDNIEWRQVYNEACNHAERITAPDSKQAVMLILQLLNGLYEMIEEMQLSGGLLMSATLPQFHKPTFDEARINLLVWGASGCGKTTLAATAPGPQSLCAVRQSRHDQHCQS